jgi:alpha-L-rhamnosidase
MQFNAKFIKTATPFVKEYSEKAPAPMFRKKFTAKTGKAKLYVCGLGYGYYYLNGKAVTSDLLTAPASEYHKAVWYNVYDVTELLKEGENVFAAMLGNGFFNESFKSHWNNQDSPWRDNPKFAAQLVVDGETILSTDDGFVCTENSPINYNHLR